MTLRLATKTGSALLLSLLLFATACGGDDTKTATPAASASATAVSSAANADFGTILTDGVGMTLYLFDNDKPIKPQSSCSGACEQVWPLVLASEGSTVGADVDPAKLGQVTRTDGRVQLTYNNWPLYRYIGDTAAGETNGQGVEGIWHVAGVDGKPITVAKLVPAPASSSSGYGY